MAGEAPPFGSLINPADPRFLPPGNMPDRMARYCLETGQAPPNGVGEIVRCALESLALQYRKTLHEVERLTAMRVEQLHVVGGGSQNRLLNQFTADATGIPVLTGPVEATAIGNVLVQAICMGELDSLATARELVRRSFEVTTFKPQEREHWNTAAEKFAKLK
jgi:rhamnulokinase